MDPFVAGALISGVGSLASGLASTGLSYSQSKDLMKYQYDLQQEAINRQNLYNSPAEQMKRLAAANLSPNLVYGSGVDGNQSSAASPSQSSRHVDLGNPLQDFNTAFADSQRLSMEKIRQRNEAFESRARRLNLEAKTLGVLADNAWKDKTLDTRIKTASQKLANMVAQETLIYQQHNNLRVQANVLVEQADNIAAKTRLTQEQCLTEVVKRRSLEAGIRLTSAQISQAASYIAFLNEGTNLRRLGHKMQETAFDAQKVFQEWKAKHPNITLTFDMVKEILGMGQQIGNIASNFIP